MDANAQLALMVKAKRVFEIGDEFLSFPALSPLSYQPDQLAFIPAPTTPTDILAFSEFSMLANALPSGVLFTASLDTFLWDTYLNVLRNAQLANGTLTADQQTAYQQAEAFLYTTASDGTQTPSQQVLAYNQYRQAYITATQSYTAAELTASASTDPAVQTQWQNVTQPALQAAVDSAMVDWQTKGDKAQVEQFRQVEQSCAAASPALQWQTWKSQCNPDIDFLTDSNNRQFGPTVYSPYDILSQTSWPTFTLTSAEVQELIAAAPPELAGALGAGTGGTDIDSITFEFSSVALNRPWFHADAFSARFWRFADPAAQLSDGNMPPLGSWPAYVTALVFARNIVETTHTTGGGPVKRPIYVFEPMMREQFMRTPTVMMARPATFTRGVIAAPAQPAAPATATVTMRPDIALRLNAMAFATAGSTPPAPTTSQSTSGTQVSILAFVCKRLGKCPNPDPSFDWGTPANQ